MNNETQETLSAFQLAEIFPDDHSAEIWLERLRWPSKNDIRCPSCGSDSIIDVVSRRPTPFRCRPCRFRFSVRKGTVLESTNVGLRKWIFAGYAFVTSPKGVASTRVAQDLGVSQPTAWFMLQRLREGFADENNEPINLLDEEKMEGRVEVDEAMLGGQWKYMHHDRKRRFGTWMDAKDIVAGALNRETGQVSAKVIPNRTKEQLEGFIKERVEDGTIIYTDDYAAYDDRHPHGVVNHSKWKYADKEVHTNGIENLWSIEALAETL